MVNNFIDIHDVLVSYLGHNVDRLCFLNSYVNVLMVHIRFFSHLVSYIVIVVFFCLGNFLQ